MHWTLWTMIISIILLVIEFLVFRCFHVSYRKNNDWEDVDFPIFVLLIIGVLAFVPIVNLITAVAFPISTSVNMSENYNYAQLKPIGGNENNVMLRILHFLSKSI